MTYVPGLYLPAFDQAARRWHHFSVSLLKSFQDCERIPYFRYVVGIKPPKTKAQARGGGWHAQQEHYLKTGQDVLNDRMQPAKEHLPTPGPDLMVEYGFDLKPKVEGVPFDYAKSVVRLAGLPLEGYVDILARRDPRVARLYDLKTTKHGKNEPDEYVMTEEELRRDIQYLGYAAFVWEAPTLFPEAEEIEARWIYAFSDGQIRAKAVTIREPLEAAYDRWLTVNPHAERLKSLENAQSEDDIETTGKHKGTCENWYGKACPFRSMCFKNPAAVLRSVVRQHALRNGNRVQESKLLTSGDQTMSLQARLRPQAPAVPVTQASNTAPVQPAPAPIVPTAAQFGMDDPQVLAMLDGRAGKVQVTPNGTRLVFDKDDNFIGKLPPVPATQAASTTPPPAPVPAPVAQPVAAPAPAGRCEFEDAGKRCVLPKGHPGSMHDLEAAAIPAGITPPDAPKSDPLARPEEKKTRRSKQPTEVSAATVPTVDKGTAPPAQAPTPEQGSSAAAPTARGVGPLARVKGLKLYVDCVPYRTAYEHLDDYAAYVAREVAKALQVEDFRLADIGAVKGRGGIAALVRQEPPPAGVYVAFLGAFDGPMATVVEALKPLAEELVEGV